MRTQVAKWGNSLAVRIPRAFVAQIGLEPGSMVELSAEGDALVLRKPAIVLEDLLRAITKENRHGETDFGRPAGRELW